MMTRTFRKVTKRAFKTSVSLAGALFLLAGCANLAVSPTDPVPPVGDAPELNLVPVKFEDMPGWPPLRPTEALPAFLLSCERLANRPDDGFLGDDRQFGTYAEWKEICQDASIIRPGNELEARYFLESRFAPYLVFNGAQSTGLFTGYYEPQLRGSWSRSADFSVPIYSRPKDIVSINLGSYRDEYEGTQLAGRVEGDRVVPFYSRAEINAGALQGRELEILWVDDPVDAFFLHIQGSGRVQMPDGSTVRLGYAGRNGHKYTSVGRELVARGEMRLADVTAPAIREWMRARPAAAQELMNRNASYVFFRVIDGDGPIGAQGVPLTPGRSLAVDDAFLPYGVPLWLDTTDPLDTSVPLQRLMIAQDTGSAILGPVRGDVFWGFGEEAALRAGLMKQPGRYYVLVPGRVIPVPGS